MALIKDYNKALEIDPQRPAFGIDLGTTNSAIAYFDKKEVHVLVVDDDGSRTLPSYVSYTTNPPRVGKRAQEDMRMSAPLVAYDSKRMIGLRFDNSEIQQNKDFWTFSVVERDKRPVYDMGVNNQVLPELVSAEILKKLKEEGLSYLRSKQIEHDPDQFEAVIAVPDYFKQSQKQATLEAAQTAGIKVLSLMTEPAAAAHAYGFDHRRYTGYTILVFDFGGGTCDVSVVKVENSQFTVVGHAGDNQLGGRDLDNLLLSYYAKKIKNSLKLDVYHPDNVRAKIRLREACEKLKKELSSQEKVMIQWDTVHEKLTNEYLTRESLRRISEEPLNRCRSLCHRALEQAKIKAADVNEILLVGGSTRSSIVQDELKKDFSNVEFKMSINPDEAIAYGAAIRAAQLLDPKHACKETVQDKTPIGIGVALIEDRYEIVLPRNTAFSSPAATKKFITVENNQTVMVFAIYEGERLIASKNTKLGSIELQVPPEPAGKVVAHLSMEIDKNGILKATARYNDNVKELELNFSKIVPAESVQEMLNALETHKETDMAEAAAKKARTEFRIEMEKIKSMILKHSEPKRLAELSKKIKFVEKWLNSNTDKINDEIQTKFKEINNEAEKVFAIHTQPP